MIAAALAMPLVGAVAPLGAERNESNCKQGTLPDNTAGGVKLRDGCVMYTSCPEKGTCTPNLGNGGLMNVCLPSWKPIGLRWFVVDLLLSLRTALINNARQAIFLLASVLICFPVYSQTPWWLRNLELEGEADLKNLLYVGDTQVTFRVIYVETGFFLAIKDGKNELFLQSDAVTNKRTYWNRGKNRLFPYYSENGIPPVAFTLTPHLRQYSFGKLGEPTSDGRGTGASIERVEQKSFSVIVYSNEIVGGSVVTTHHVQHDNDFFSQYTMSLVVLSDNGSRREQLLFDSRLSNPHPLHPQVAQEWEATCFNHAGGVEARANVRIRKVSTVPEGTTLQEVAKRFTDSTGVIQVDGPNDDFGAQVRGAPPSVYVMSTLFPALPYLGLFGVIAILGGLVLRITTKRRPGTARGFTLIELLVVVGILLVLTSIGFSNLIYAQVRTKVTRVHTDLKIMRDGVEAYSMDHNRYPRMTNDTTAYEDRYEGQGSVLQPINSTLGPWITTPVAYLSRFDQLSPYDPGAQFPVWVRIYGYVNRAEAIKYGQASDGRSLSRYDPNSAYRLLSLGPLGVQGFPEAQSEPYDPTNGLLSTGILFIGSGSNGTMAK